MNNTISNRDGELNRVLDLLSKINGHKKQENIDSGHELAIPTYKHFEDHEIVINDESESETEDLIDEPARLKMTNINDRSLSDKKSMLPAEPIKFAFQNRNSLENSYFNHTGENLKSNAYSRVDSLILSSNRDSDDHLLNTNNNPESQFYKNETSTESSKELEKIKYIYDQIKISVQEESKLESLHEVVNESYKGCGIPEEISLFDEVLTESKRKFNGFESSITHTDTINDTYQIEYPNKRPNLLNFNDSITNKNDTCSNQEYTEVSNSIFSGEITNYDSEIEWTKFDSITPEVLIKLSEIMRNPLTVTKIRELKSQQDTDT
ncbi:hypothetical protein AYI70_g7019 [Smittium culicis]|uniref:Uncharacterized protein n=1 Tax=Smittium culicis TaxID=133412 RepID=A0A1R1XMF0_9FUNG|nr:hypothetical protein AYI70_g7019 [Smittium culicis]